MCQPLRNPRVDIRKQQMKWIRIQPRNQNIRPLSVENRNLIGLWKREAEWIIIYASCRDKNWPRNHRISKSREPTAGYQLITWCLSMGLSRVEYQKSIWRGTIRCWTLKINLGNVSSDQFREKFSNRVTSIFWSDQIRLI